MADWSGKQGRRGWRWAAAVVAAVVVVDGAAFVVGRLTAARDTRTAASDVDVGSVATSAPYAGPTKPTGPVAGGPAGSTPDDGTGWRRDSGPRDQSTGHPTGPLDRPK